MIDKIVTHHRKILKISLWVILLVLFLAWPLTHLDAYAWSNDEGLYVQRAALVNAGHRLYSEAYFNKPPLLVWTLCLVFKLAGTELVVARLLALALTLVGGVVLAFTAYELTGRWEAAYLVAVLIAVLPEMPVRAFAVTSDLPALSLGLMGLASALVYRRTRSMHWLVLSAAGCAGALLIHPILLYIGAPVAVVLFGPGRGKPLRWRKLSIFVSVGLTMALVLLALVDRPAFFRWVIKYNVAGVGADLQLTSADVNRQQLVAYLIRHWPWFGAAVLGGSVWGTHPERRHTLVVPLTWLAATLATLLVWSPVWEHYLIYAAIPLSLLGSGMVIAIDQKAVRVLALMLGIALLVWRADAMMPQPEGGPAWTSEQSTARAYLRKTVPPDAMVATDDPLLAFVAGRMVPPLFTEATFRQIRVGAITGSSLIGSTLRYRPPVVLFATGRLASVREFEAWVVATAEESRVFGDLMAYRLAIPKPSAGEPLARLGPGIILRDATLSGSSTQPGEILPICLFWEAKVSIPTDYIVFVHLIDSEGALVAQHDSPPLQGHYPTGAWEPGVTVPDEHPVTLPSDLAPGRYRLVAGMYDRASMIRVPAAQLNGTRWRDDAVLLAMIEVEGEL